METKSKVLQILKANSHDFVSGQRISDELGITRTAIWKNIKSLRDNGYTISSVTNKGYKLDSCPDILTYEEIKEELKTKFIGRKIVHFNSTNSTNIEAKKLAETGEKEGTIVIAEEQTLGKARMGESWYSPKGEGIWMSIILRPEVGPEFAAEITNAAIEAVGKGLIKIEPNIEIKKPNDIVLDGRKICGILTEIDGELTLLNYIIIGIGINVNQEVFPQNADLKVTSLRICRNKAFSRKKILCDILNSIEPIYVELITKIKNKKI
ncbi:biotin--[acetyl-CoA-carboxylase] ligase [Clostridium felsineum]|uniref:Bifunctional ligase/repressor BirA n=1 Tax=Clostridium felsineum TaxID=36839 RepID=A0A1S8LNS5_9CLOT|nr:biotin--[acetyl-CoA-carboxylase] ligase [Clostridium felsineum]URZ04747.1 Bifunctional ligase/repressor BirA [Clostridium felsineum]URZ09788.1 Bifunctional ligase/repressor BirA [Clostridium felsineum]